MEASEQVSTSNVVERSGTLWGLAERFMAMYAPSRSPRDAAREQLRALARAVELFLARDEVAPQEEHAFVEGAGAWLGVILIAHLPAARYECRERTHRIKLGRHGYCDPFRTIEAALDSDDPRALLAREVGVAEAEHQSEGPISRVVKALAEQLRASRPELSIVQHFDLDLTVAAAGASEPIAIDLRRAVDSTREQNAAAVARVVERLVSMLPCPHTGDTDLAPDRERLFPRLCRADLLSELSSQGRTALWSYPLHHELTVALQVESEGRSRYLRVTEVRSLGLASRAVLELALENLERHSQRFRLVCEHGPHGALYVARTGDGRDSARLLLPTLHAALVARLGKNPFVGVPHRDTFFACAADEPALVRELAQRTEHDAARAPHRLSPHPYRLLGPAQLAL